MKSKKEKSNEEKSHSIHLEEIIQHPNRNSSSNLSEGNWGSTLFEPQRQQSNLTPGSDNSRNTGGTDPTISAPEKKLTIFALRLAILEKAASGLGTLGFIWATVVLLGGFAIAIKTKDFWFVTVILIIEGTRIFSRSHEIEWQQQATTWSLASAGRYSFRALVSSSQFLFRAMKALFKPLFIFQSENQHGSHISSELKVISGEPQSQDPENKTRRTWRSSDVPLLPYAGWVFLSRNVSRVFYWLQLISAAACAVLPIIRLVQQDYGDGEDNEKRNLKPALNIFYGLALAEALLFLMEKAYWNWKIGYNKLLDSVCNECALGSSGMVSIKRFFYDSYSKCIEGSIFDGLKMDLVTFALELLVSDSRDEQLIAARILEKFVISDQFSSYTLRKIGSSTPVIERLIEMLNWKNPEEEEIRRLAAKIVSKLSGKKQNALRVTEIPGAMESISSLLYTGRINNARPNELGQRLVVADQINYEFSVFNLLGLHILKKLSQDHDNCWKIGNARGLMPKIVDFTATGENMLRSDLVLESQIQTTKRSLQLLRTLVSTTGVTGKALREQISENVFTVTNIRGILQYGERHLELQKLAIEVLTSLAMDEVAREKIGNTGGVIRLLLEIFFKPCLTEEQSSVGIEAGEALAMLTFPNKRNCKQILKGNDVIESLISSLDDPVMQVNACRILKNLCAYSGPECVIQLKGIVAALPTVLKAIMTAKGKLLEVSLGLSIEIFNLIDPEEHDKQLEKSGVEDTKFANRLVQILKTYGEPEITVPRIRRFAIELKILMMKMQGKYIDLFKNLEAHEVLKCVAETTSELESFNIFSGSVGLDPNETTLSSLIDVALELME